MNDVMMNVIYSVSVISGLGLLFGLGLGYAGKKLAVDENEIVLRIMDVLPKANCGGCGYPGCDQLAHAIAAGEAKSNACPAGGASCASLIADILGEEAIPLPPSSAFVKCHGNNSSSIIRYNYQGQMDCRSAALLAGGGAKTCQYGCLGMGSCYTVCKFNAISFQDGIAVVDRDKCVMCGVCVRACPRNVIAMVPHDSNHQVACNSHDSGKKVREICKTGCIGCKLCEKTCQHGAILFENQLARIDYRKCTNCGQCEQKCPTKAIRTR